MPLKHFVLSFFLFYKEIKKHNLPLPKYSIITHHHWDHSFGLYYSDTISYGLKETQALLKKHKELLENKIPNFHGDDVGVCTLIMLKLYNSLLAVEKINCHKENPNWEDIKAVYGELSEDMMKLNTPDTITDNVGPKLLEEKFNEIKDITRSVPNYDKVYQWMKKAGCKLDFEQTGKSKEFIRECYIYHPYMRRRLSLKRLLNMSDFDVNSFNYEK